MAFKVSLSSQAQRARQGTRAAAVERAREQWIRVFLSDFLYRQKADIIVSDVCLAAQYVCVCSPALTSVKHTQRLVDREQRREMC